MEKLINKKVMHSKFGSGIIVEVVGAKRVVVKFDNLEENKAFVYPEGFGSFLRFEDDLLQDNVSNQIVDKKEQETIAKEKATLEWKEQYDERKKADLEFAREVRKAARKAKSKS